MEEKTRTWLMKFFPQIKKIYFIYEDYEKKIKIKARICKELNIDLIIGDNLDYVKECSKKNIKVFLFDPPWNRDDNLNIKRVKSWDEIGNLLMN